MAKEEKPKEIGKFKAAKPLAGLKKPKGFKNPKQTMQGFKGVGQGMHGKEAGKKIGQKIGQTEKKGKK